MTPRGWIALLLLCVCLTGLTAPARADVPEVVTRAGVIADREVGEVLLDGVVVIRLRAPAGGLTPGARAQIVAERLRASLAQGVRPEDVIVAAHGRAVVILIREQLLCMVDAVDARLNGVTPTRLATQWATNIARQMGGVPGTPRVPWVNPRDGADMIWVPAGEFIMGSAREEGDDVRPRRRVYLDGFWIYTHEVTVAQYRRFCAASGRALPPAPPWGWHDDHPVVNVTWFDAKAYADWAGAALPTEAQWEKAARGTDGRPYPWGATWDAARTHSAAQGTGMTAPVKSFSGDVSPYGVFDMAGNVWEWCADWHAFEDPNAGPARNPTGPPTGEFRVQKGGSWTHDLHYLFTAAHRWCSPPADFDDYIGFRCVVIAPEQ